LQGYIQHIPSAPLNRYIYDFYYIEGSAPYPRLKVFPMPVVQLMVNFGDAFQLQQPDQSEPRTACTESCWTGLWSTYHIVHWPPAVQMLGVHFKPGGAYPFLRLPLSELHNLVVPLDAIWGHDAAEIRERLYLAATVQEKFALFERLLLARLDEGRHGLNVVQKAIGQIVQQHGALSIRRLSDDIGISQKHLGTQFKRIVGVSPKELARCYRFARVLNSIDLTRPVDWTLLAHQASFYDQSHFNKDFLAFTGHRPGDYLRLRRHIHAENPEQAQNLGQLPIG
jgi:AraC-like DNA-binding protein